MFDAHLIDASFDYARLFRALVPLASILMTAGFISEVSSERTPDGVLRALLRVILIVAVLSQFDGLCNLAQDQVNGIIIQLDAHPDKVAEKYLDRILANRGKDGEEGFWSKLTNPAVTLMEAIIAALLFLFSLLAGILVSLLNIGQLLLLQALVGVSPLFMGFLSIRATRSTGIHFMQAAAAVILTPLGWAIVSLVSDSLIDYATNNSYFVPGAFAGGRAYAFRNLVTGFALGVWLVMSTIFSPWIMYRLVATGAQGGVGLVQSIRSFRIK